MQDTVDQAAIDEILASAEADTPESRIDKLEKELDVLKGSVKRLLLDLRETLNNLENPFQNLQNLAEGALSTMQQPQPQIQVIPAAIPEPEKSLEEEGEGEEKEEEESLEDVPEDEVARCEESIGEVMPKEEGDSLQPQVGVYEIERKERAEPKPGVEERWQKPEMFTKYDIVTLFNLMEWVKGMLEKYSIDSLKIMLEVFEAAGYITEEAKDFVAKLAELIALNDGFEDMLLELYRLHKLMNPQDTSMDSKLLNLILEKRL
ncbi:hypothetical protein [Archaeoglobus sp.]